MTRFGAGWVAAVGLGLVLGLAGAARGEDGRAIAAEVADLRPEATRDQVVYQGTAVQGARVTIGVDGPIPPGTTFRWKQVEGPAVAIDEPNSAKIKFVVPIDAKRLAFVATVADERGSREVRVAVPVSTPPPVPPAPPIGDEGPPAVGTEPVADAGDDQIGLVGRRITLNGARSRPQNRVGFRWMHLSGPAIAEPRQEGPYFTFVPTAPGVYRFALLVAFESKVSMPSLVTVEVGQRPGSPGQTTAPAPADAVSPMTRWARGAVATIPGGEETATQVGDVFEAIAGRASLYTSFSQLQSELTRRLDVIVPLDPSARNQWSSQVFVPLSQMTASELLAAGIDLRVPSSSDRPLEPAQRERIGAFYRSLAVAFRSRPAKP
jgi:hypothetical protein